MNTLAELGLAVSLRRRELRLSQGEVARLAGLSAPMLSRLETGKAAEFGTRKLLAVLAVLGMELDVVPQVLSGSLDDLRRERSGR